MGDLPDPLRRTLIFDNGKEFAEHDRLVKQLDIDIHFAKAYAVWQRGGNANLKGLLRQFYPKGRTSASSGRPTWREPKAS